MKDKEPKGLLDIFKFGALGFAILILIVYGVESYKNNIKAKSYIMKSILALGDVSYNITTEPIEAWLKVAEEKMPDREKLNTYFKDEIKVEEKLYSDENTTIYLDNIKGDDNSFLRFNFKKKDKVERDKGELVTIGKEIELNEHSYFLSPDITAEVYDRDNNKIEDVTIYRNSLENEDFMVFVRKDTLTNMNWPISFKLNLTEVTYEIKN
ncbi:hypothetical protein [Clostridium sp.]|uniref:hypothetical protein n=1 Tax=Clostridium sp. TaxID=1506 RepID=UPI002FCC8F8D